MKKVVQTLLSLIAGSALVTAGLAQDTYFIDNHGSFNNVGDWWMQGFYSGSGTNTFVLRFASDYIADAAVIGQDQASNFQNNRAFKGYSVLDNKIGTAYVTLASGNYLVGTRNQARAANAYRLELDTRIQVSPDTYYYYTYQDAPMTGAHFVGKNGGKLWHGFTAASGYKYFIDGCNTGLSTYVIPSSSLAAFRSGGTFNHYPAYGGTDNALPGHDELALAPGSYYLAFQNDNTNNKPAVYTLERWKAVPRPTGLNIQMTGPASWRSSGSKLTLALSRISNQNSSGRSGTLRLRLWATKSPYAGYQISGYILGLKTFSPLNAGWYYYDINSTVSFARAPRGTYYSTLTLEEYTTAGYMIRDYINFDGTVSF